LQEAVQLVLEANRLLAQEQMQGQQIMKDFLAQKICRDLQVPAP